MIAPDELSRNRKMVLGKNAAARTQRKPTTDDARIAVCGTPRLVTRIRLTGASRRAVSTKSMRDAVYSPEFRQDSTAVSTTAFIRLAAAGMPMMPSAVTNGEEPSLFEFHGTITASRKTDPTKNSEIRVLTELVAFLTARTGSGDSAAAIVAISAPTMEKMTTTMAEKIAPAPFGKNPPCAHRLLKSRCLFGQMPKT